MTYLDTDCPKLQRAMMIEEANDAVHDARGCWRRAATAGDKQAMALFERHGRDQVAKLENGLAAFEEIFGKRYRLKNPALKSAAKAA